MLQAKTARGFKWQVIEIGGRYLVSLFVFTALARLLDATSFGLVALVGLYLGFAQMITEQGLSTAIIQRPRLERDHLNSAFWCTFGLSGLLCAGTMLLAAPVAALFNEPRLAPLLRWASISLVVNGSATIHHALFLKEIDLRRPALRTLIANALAGAVGVGMAVAGCGVWALIGQQLVASISGAIFLWLVSPWRPQLRFSLAHLKELLGIGGAVSMTTFIQMISGRADQFCIARFLGPAMLGQYVIAGKLVELLTSAIYQPVVAVSLPALSKVQEDRPRFANAVYKAMSLNALVSFPALIGLAAIANDVVPFVFGQQWQAAAPVLQLLAIYILVLGLQVFFHPMLLAVGRPGSYLVLSILQAGGAAIACAIGVRFGVRAVVAGLILNSIVVGAVSFVFVVYRLGISVKSFWKPCLGPAAAALLMYLSVTIVRYELPTTIAPWLRVFSQVGVGAIVYSALMMLFARNDVGLLWSFLRSTAEGRKTAGAATDYNVAAVAS